MRIILVRPGPIARLGGAPGLAPRAGVREKGVGRNWSGRGCCWSSRVRPALERTRSCGALLERMPRMRYSVSATTRAPRDGRTRRPPLHLHNEGTVQERLRNGDFLEWREYAGNLYGTPKSFVEETLSNGDDLSSNPKSMGRWQSRPAIPGRSWSSWSPRTPNASRLGSKGAAPSRPDELAARLATAQEELTFIRRFDYLVINHEAPVEQRRRRSTSCTRSSRQNACVSITTRKPL